MKKQIDKLKMSATILKKEHEEYINAYYKNVGNMISSHIKILEANSGNAGYMPYYDRLVMLLTILESGWE